MYNSDALGLVDEELITLIGFSLMQRCESVLMATEARKVFCPSCDILIICTGQRWSHETPIICHQCGWAATYGQWRDSWRQRDLVSGKFISLHP